MLRLPLDVCGLLALQKFENEKRSFGANKASPTVETTVWVKFML
jgi:hypothetical protein